MNKECLEFIKIASKSIPIHEAICELEENWKPEMPPTTVAMGVIGRTLARHVDKIEIDKLRLIFTAVEEMMVYASDDTKNAVATGFLEALLHQYSKGCFAFKKVVPLLGIESKKYCIEWDRFTGVKTDGLYE